MAPCEVEQGVVDSAAASRHFAYFIGESSGTGWETASVKP